MCAVLNNHGGFYSKMAYIEEARRLDIPILPPDVNYSDQRFTCERNSIRCGLSPVYELTERTIQNILDERQKRPFSDLYDFLNRTRAGEKETMHLIKAGALRSIHPSEAQLLLLNKVFFKNNRKKLVSEFITAETDLPAYNQYQRILNELEMLDFSISAHPLILFADLLEKNELVPSTQLEHHRDKQILFCGWLVTSRRVSTNNNQYMKFLTLEDHFGLCEAVLFSEPYTKYGHLIRTHGPYLVKGKVQSRLPGEANIIIEEISVVEIEKRELEQLLQKKMPLMTSES
jgi:DNA polymerase III alpha subunit